jgi:hypothetical protein
MNPISGVKRQVLGQVADGVVGLGAEDRPDLVHALEHANHDLLVELRALGEIGAPAEPSTGKTLAPLSVAEATTFGVKISVNPAWSSALRNPDADAAAICANARRAGCRSDTAAWSKRVGSCALSFGLRSSNGGASVGSVTTSTAGSTNSTPRGARSFATTLPSTSTTVSARSSARASRLDRSVSTT